MSAAGQTVTIATIVLLSLTVFISGSPVAKETDDNHLSDQLSKLKSILQRLEDKAREQKEDPVTDETSDLHAPPLKSVVSELPVDAKEPMAKPTNDIVGDVKSDVTKQVRLESVKAFLDSLSPRQLEQLKALGQSFYSKKEDAGKFFDVTNKDTSEDWRSLASELEKERDQLYLETRKDDNVALPVETEEGSFGALKDEVKYSIEKNLLADLALARHSGISVKDLIEDIMGTGNQKID